MCSTGMVLFLRWDLGAGGLLDRAMAGISAPAGALQGIICRKMQKERSGRKKAKGAAFCGLQPGAQRQIGENQQTVFHSGEKPADRASPEYQAIGPHLAR